MSVPNIDHLEFEEETNQNEGSSNEKPQFFDDVKNIPNEEAAVVNDDESLNINKSIKIVEALEEKAQKHNSKNPTQKVSISQLRTVFCKGAEQHEGYLYISRNKCLFSLGRVNMYLRQKEGEIIKISNSKEKKITIELDISEAFLPDKKDIIRAKADMEEYKIDFDFKNVNDLYLEVEPIGLKDYIYHE